MIPIICSHSIRIFAPHNPNRRRLLILRVRPLSSAKPATTPCARYDFDSNFLIIADRLWSRYSDEVLDPAVKNFFVASDGVRISPSTSMRPV